MNISKKEIYRRNEYRIIEVYDCFSDLNDLEGDMFNPEFNPDISPDTLKIERQNFQNKIDEHGVYGYILEKWNPEIGQGWENIDSCFGFVGRYNSSINEFNHYIVEEFIQRAEKKS